MKKTVKKEVEYCDACGKEIAYSTPCIICGKVACCECKKTTTTKYNHAVHFSGSGDGLYCNECLSKPIPEEHAALLQAYWVVVSLRHESIAWNEAFDIRRKEAEAKIKQLQE